ncbi:MTH1187 family thiamine-binding protein [Salisediminibacterium halotolerans]|uniref:Uncharacterized protein, MTH1187 family n=1 Tax=Salisediminibacterium halotolerans TaxID=517425 RepID=A0A1H9U4X7_9BACI|nr:MULTISPECIES: MTH1187 family thiamine-binding protein [Salisediminibacterium]RLJ81081.1 uncharacterized protein (TIGR00106 family) [Actinophytocola xinjiangensis]RPE84110.1 uncharacterized protein (TIGR00106 family) [Salisediminibacterium halotolerans]TWG38508.1 uncharacterized protein (TIGR00106 family) [Salisediminibacterium halotolerans]SES04123.1 uncharacterized protein, MTH1187 family [Salisediminibacterium haloalkalitolerans]GEL08660.1 hypothetical protein SHA02_20760 [Salisediminibac
MALMEISVVPVGTDTESFSSDIQQALSIIEQNGLDYQVTPTSTIIKGDIDKLMDVAQVIHINEMEKSAKRVVTSIKIDDRTDKEMTLDGQRARVSKSER